jgi:hypothetical protein
VRRNGTEIDLLPREFKVLEYLVRNEGQVVPRAVLLRHVWNLNFDPTTNIIDVYISRVRRKLERQNGYPLIHTIRGVGFGSLVVMMAVLTLAVLGLAYRAMFGGYVFPALPPITGSDIIVRNSSDTRRPRRLRLSSRARTRAAKREPAHAHQE